MVIVVHRIHNLSERRLYIYEGGQARSSKVHLTALFTDRQTQISTIQKFGIQPCAHSLIASPFGLAIIA